MYRSSLLLLVQLTCFADCSQYGSELTLSGKLSLRDEAGYNQFIVLELQPPICTAADPRPGSQWERPQTSVREVQAGVYGSDAAARSLDERLTRLLGHSVTVKGILFAAQTGYHRTYVQLGVNGVEPLDSLGHEALKTPRVEPVPKNISAFDVTVHAGARLMIEARETGSKAKLDPPDLYVTHNMTGTEFLYVGCREGYERTRSSSSEKGGLGCLDGAEPMCGTSAFPKVPVIIKFRCIKLR